MPIIHSMIETKYLITDGTFTIYRTIDSEGKITLQTNNKLRSEEFIFMDSKPETVKAIGELISYAAGLGK